MSYLYKDFLRQIGHELTVPFSNIADALVANHLGAFLHSLDNFGLMNADEIMSRDLIDNDPMKTVLRQQAIAPVLPVVRRHRFEPFVIETM